MGLSLCISGRVSQQAAIPVGLVVPVPGRTMRSEQIGSSDGKVSLVRTDHSALN